jgi:sporulation protein YlmC with PRC-barrel domain
MSTNKQTRLQELDRSNFEIVKEEPDIRGWDVRSHTGHKIGAVEDLIIDVQERKVRYMIVDLDDNELKLNHRKILIPIGLAELHKEHDDVLLPGVTLDEVCQLPDYDRKHFTPDVERAISSTFGTSVLSAVYETPEKFRNKNLDERTTNRPSLREEELDPAFYQHEHYNLDNLYKNRLHTIPPAKSNETEFERGLKLWERRSEGGIIDRGELDDTARTEIIKNRRSEYRKRRYDE